MTFRPGHARKKLRRRRLARKVGGPFMVSSSSPIQAPPRAFHFLGICGTAMGAVAAMLRDEGYTVTGSDESVYPPMSTFLAEKGIAIESGYRPENLPSEE